MSINKNLRPEFGSRGFSGEWSKGRSSGWSGGGLSVVMGFRAKFVLYNGGKCMAEEIAAAARISMARRARNSSFVHK